MLFEIARGRLEVEGRAHARGISGLKNGARIESAVWNEYDGQYEKLAEDYNRLLNGKVSTVEDSDEDLKVPAGLDKVRIAKFRVNQSFFRHAVLSAYGTTCCITGITDSRLLIAKHNAFSMTTVDGATYVWTIREA